MVGIFSRFSGSSSRNGHRRTQSAIDEREAMPQNTEATLRATDAVTGATHGFEVAIHFKPLEHPSEPVDNDRPIQCPLPEPSILNDGRIWKERVTASARRRPDLAVMQEGEPLESEVVIPKPRPRANRMILPSISAPEHSILKLLEECNASGI